jgi:carbamoyl-phosphate synthase large subunit
MNPTTILITGIGGPAGSALARQLRHRNCHLIGTDVRQLPSSTGVHFHQVPPAHDPGMMPALRRIATLHSVDLLIPTVSDELPEIALAGELFAPDVRVLISGPGPVATANDKLFTAARLQRLGVPVPRFGLPSDFKDTRTALTAMGGPIVVKPRVSRGARGVIVAERPRDLDWATLTDDQIVQEFIPGTEYAPVVYRSNRPDTGNFGTVPDFSAVPESRAATDFGAVLEKTELTHGRIGNAVGVRRLPDGEAPDVRVTALAAARGLGLTGPVDIDVRRRADGTPVVLEVNARFGANSEAVPELLDAVLAEATLGKGPRERLLV